MKKYILILFLFSVSFAQVNIWKLVGTNILPYNSTYLTAIRLATETPAATGAIRYGSGTVQYYNGSAWISLSGSGGGASTGNADSLGSVPASGYVRTTRTLAINGVSYDLSANRTWSVGTLVATDTINGRTYSNALYAPKQATLDSLLNKYNRSDTTSILASKSWANGIFGTKQNITDSAKVSVTAPLVNSIVNHTNNLSFAPASGTSYDSTRIAYLAKTQTFTGVNTFTDSLWLGVSASKYGTLKFWDGGSVNNGSIKINPNIGLGANRLYYLPNQSGIFIMDGDTALSTAYTTARLALKQNITDSAKSAVGYGLLSTQVGHLFTSRVDTSIAVNKAGTQVISGSKYFTDTTYVGDVKSYQSVKLYSPVGPVASFGSAGGKEVYLYGINPTEINYGTVKIGGSGGLYTTESDTIGLQAKLNAKLAISDSSASGYVRTTRTLTINGSTQDLSANRTWSVGTILASDTALSTAYTTARLALKKDINDTVNIITGYTTRDMRRRDSLYATTKLNIVDTGKVAVGYGLDLSQVNHTATITADTTNELATIYDVSQKQNTIPNLADTSKYFKSYDSSGTVGFYRRAYVDALLSAKQNTIPNLSDTSKYLEGGDTLSLSNRINSKLAISDSTVGDVGYGLLKTQVNHTFAPYLDTSVAVNKAGTQVISGAKTFTSVVNADSLHSTKGASIGGNTSIGGTLTTTGTINGFTLRQGTSLSDTTKFVSKSDTTKLIGGVGIIIGQAGVNDTVRVDTASVIMSKAYATNMLWSKSNLDTANRWAPKGIIAWDSTYAYKKAYTNALLSAKQNTISNIADTSKYLKKSDSTNIVTGFTTRDMFRRDSIAVTLKQNTIANLSDTSKYLKKSDSTNIVTGFTTRDMFRRDSIAVTLKQGTIANLSDTSKYLKKSDSTNIVTGFTTRDMFRRDSVALTLKATTSTLKQGAYLSDTTKFSLLADSSIAGYGILFGQKSHQDTIKIDTSKYATSTQSGFLRQTDWATFNAKGGGAGSVTSITQGTGMNFNTSPITTTGTINVDTTFVVTRYDTLAMFDNRVKRDTISLSNRIDGKQATGDYATKANVHDSIWAYTNQGVKTSSSPTFVNATLSGNLNADSLHTTKGASIGGNTSIGGTLTTTGDMQINQTGTSAFHGLTVTKATVDDYVRIGKVSTTDAMFSDNVGYSGGWNLDNVASGGWVWYLDVAGSADLKHFTAGANPRTATDFLSISATGAITTTGAINGNTTLASTASPTFGGLTLNGNLALGTNAITSVGAVTSSGNFIINKTNPQITLNRDLTTNYSSVNFRYGGATDSWIIGTNVYGSGDNFELGDGSAKFLNIAATTGNATFAGTIASSGLTADSSITGVGGHFTRGLKVDNSVVAKTFNPTGSQEVFTSEEWNIISGTTTISQPFAGTSYKKVIIYFSSCEMDATNTYTFPTAFSITPIISHYDGTLNTSISSLTTTSVTFYNGSPRTGFIMLEGY